MKLFMTILLLCSCLHAAESNPAILHVYRDVEKLNAHIYKMPVYLDGEKIAILPGERQGTLKIAPGAHTLSSKAPVTAFQRNDDLQINVESGQEYYVRGEIITGMMKVHWRFVQISSEQGKLDVQRLKPMDPKLIIKRSE